MMNSPNPGEEKMNNAPNPGEEDMANASNPANEPENNPPNQPEGGSNRPKRRRLPVVLRRTSIALGIPLLVGAVGGACWMWVFVHEQLAPMVQKNLTELLNRPVLLGQVESFSFNGVRFGPSSIPATPTDPDRASVQAVDVAFDPLQLLLTRTLRLDVTLVKPDAYIEEDARGRWVSTTIKSEEGKGPITTDLQAVRLQNANVVLMPQSAIAARQQSPLTPVPVPVLPQSSPALPQPQVATPQVTATPQPQVATPQATATPQPQVATPQTTVASPQTPLPNRLSGVRTLPELPAPPNSPTNNVLPVPPLPSAVTFTGVNGTGRFLEQNQRILFEAAGQSVTGGTFSISGENRPAKEETNLKLQGQNLVAPEISSLVKLPLDLQAGLVDGNLQLRLQGSNSPLIDGTALLKNVTAQAPDLPRAFAQTNGQLNFKGSQIGLENISTLYGQIPAQAIGAVDFQSGFNIAAKTSPVQVQALLNTFDLKLPVSATGEMQADLKILGPTSKPVVSGTLAATKPAVIDKLKLAAFSADFGLEGSTLAITSLKAKPAVGGQLDGSGQVKLGQIGDVAFKFQGKNLPGDAIARVYGSQPSFRIGRVQAQGQVKGPINNIETILSFNAPTGTYPASGELAISSSGKTALRNTTVNVAGGALKVNGNSSPSAGGSPRFSGTIDASKVNPGLLAQGSTGTNEPKERGTTVKGKNKPSENSNGTAVNPTLPPISGKINVAGTANPSFPDELRASGTLNVAGGTVKINDFKVLSRTWQASLIAAGIDVGRLSPQLPPQLRGKFDGRFQVYGSVDSFQPETIRATGSGQMNVAGGTLKASSIQVKAGRWQAAVQAYGVQLSRIVPQVPPQLRSPFTGTFNLSGSLVSSQPETISGTGQGTLAVAGGTVRLSNGKLNQGRFSASVEASGVELGRLSPQAPPTLGGAFTGQFDVAGNIDNFSTSTILAAGQGRLDVGGGTVTATNVKINEGRFSASVESSGVELGRLAPQVPQQLRGAIAGKLDLSGDLDKLEANAIQGTGQARLNSAGGLLTATNIKLAEGRWQAAVSATNFDLNRLNPQLKPESRLTGTFNLAGNLDKLEPNAIVGNGSGRLNTAGGTITASNVQLASGRWQAQGKADGVRLGSLSPQVPPQLRGGQLNNAAFNLVGSLADFQPQTIQGTASGTLLVAGGTIKADSLQLASGRWQARGEASNFALETLSPQIPPQLKGGKLASGSFNLAGSLANFQPQTIEGTASGTLNVAGGTITATNARLAAGRFEANLQPSKILLSRFSDQLRGRLTGDLNVSGSLAALNPSDLKASGQLNFSEGLAAIDRDLTAAFSWDGQNLQIQRATGQGLEASGVVAFGQVRGAGVPPVKDFNLNVRADNFNLTSLPVTLPNNLKVAGLVDFNGRVTGTPSAPNVVGDSLRVRNFEVAGLKFEAQLAGTVQSVAGQGTNLRLQGTEDRLELELSPKLQPVAFAIRRTAGVPADQQIEATGKTQGDLLVADVKNFPLKILKGLAPKEAIANLPPQIATQNIGGQLSGNFSLNLAQNSVVANNVAIAKPVLGPVQGDVLAINSFTYTNGVANVTNATFDQGSSRYTLAGSFNQDPKASPQFKGSVKVAQGKVQDVLKTLQIFELADLSNGFGNAASYAKADDIKPIASAGLPEQTLQTQLRRFSEIQALLDQSQRRREASPVPELRDLEGNFTGEIIAEGSLKQGIKAEFDLGGSEWKWCTSRDRCPYTANQVIVKGNFENGVLTLLPLRIESDKTLLAFSGNIGGDQQTGQLRVQNVPAEALEQFANLPVDISGQLNGTVAIAGSIQNPQARGELTLTDGRLNGAPVQAAQGGFNYADSRLAFSSNIVIEQTPNTAPTATTLPVADTQPTLVASTQPISISGSIPYKLPFASTQPDNNAIALNVDVKNEGLALLNLLTSKQVTWVDGQGQLQLKVKGTLDPATFQVNNLVAEGTADVANATIRATALPEPLTQVGGKVLFNFDRINVENLQGNFSGGVVAAAGVLPISTPITTDNPLRVNIGELALNLKGLYSGRVKGGVDITGTALAPKIGGEVQLFNGQVLLEERTPETTLASSGTSGTKQVGNTGGDSNANRTTELNGLKLVLGKDVQVTRPPILNFLATGDLIVNGTLDNPRPSGTIELKRGQVNLFTTQFRLDRGYPQTAQFVPERGLDPVLDVRLIAAVPEATRRGFVTAATSSSEISDVSITNLGSVGTVRIQARVDGPASQLSNNLELTSNPSRSESEIVALLGGSFAETLGRGDGTLGLANLAGSALLGNVQNVIGDALGLSEFRLYPTLVPNDKSRGSTLGVAAEAGIDITPKLSTSVSKVLTTDQAPQLNLRYRVNEDVLLRGGTDFSSDSRALVEYEKRF